MKSPRKADERGAYRTEFGNALHRLMETQQVSQHSLAASTGRSTSYLNKTMKGVKPANAAWCGLVAEALYQPERERELRRAAFLDAVRHLATQYGFDPAQVKLEDAPPSRSRR